MLPNRTNPKPLTPAARPHAVTPPACARLAPSFGLLLPFAPPPDPQCSPPCRPPGGLRSDPQSARQRKRRLQLQPNPHAADWQGRANCKMSPMGDSQTQIKLKRSAGNGGSLHPTAIAQSLSAKVSTIVDTESQAPQLSKAAPVAVNRGEGHSCPTGRGGNNCYPASVTIVTPPENHACHCGPLAWARWPHVTNW